MTTIIIVLMAASTVPMQASAQTPPAKDAPTGPPHAKAIGNPASWFPPDSYPPEARNAGQQGTTSFSLDIDAQGHIVQCNIVKSSGSDILDTTTCDLLVVNGRFQPARDAQGRAVPGTWVSSMRWQLVTGTVPVDDDSQ
jgi:protein TonB